MHSHSQQGFTRVELVIAVVILAVFFALGIPAIQASREASRRANCLNNLKQIGLGFQNMDSARRRFPAAVDVEKDEDGNVVALGGRPNTGWSWIVHLLPMQMGGRALYDGLSIRDDYPLSGAAENGRLLRTPIKELTCPSFSGSQYVDPRTKLEFITNYKAFGATHAASLAQATAIDPKPEPGYASEYHPDGGCYPGSFHGTDGFSKDGTAHTAIVAESTEQYFARWMVGVETVFVGLPDSVTYEEPKESELSYVVPTGYSKAPGCFWDRSTVTTNYTYLKWDYDETPYDNNGVLSVPGGLVALVGPKLPPGLRNPPTAASIGPASDHAGVVNHGLADGSVQGIAEEIDAAAYMFLITRIGGEPNEPIE